MNLFKGIEHGLMFSFSESMFLVRYVWYEKWTKFLQLNKSRSLCVLNIILLMKLLDQEKSRTSWEHSIIPPEMLEWICLIRGPFVDRFRKAPLQS